MTSNNQIHTTWSALSEGPGQLLINSDRQIFYFLLAAASSDQTAGIDMWLKLSLFDKKMFVSSD